MKILVIGGGGREHALAWKLAGDSVRPDLFCAPGNAGTATVGANVAIGAEDVDGLLAWASEERPDLTVVGPEAPLCAGLVDRFEAVGLRVFGPGREAAQMEGSKIFAKEVMDAAGVPTAASAGFTELDAARRYIAERGAPLVVKAEGLAAGKGVTICQTTAEAEQAAEDALVRGVFGEAGGRILVEDFLDGEEASILALVDGERVVMLDSSQDHKAAFDGDRGPNTGGMGAYSPAPVVTEALEREIHERIMAPVVAELRRRGIVYKGVLYAGLMITAEGLFVLEFNCRFGDPETQAVLPRLSGDLAPWLEACVDGNLPAAPVAWDPRPCVCVAMTSPGYPGPYEKGLEISGLEAAAAIPGVEIFHAGTDAVDDRVVTSGGRVLGVSARGNSLADAVRTAYNGVAAIHFEGAHYRKDIAHRALERVHG